MRIFDGFDGVEQIKNAVLTIGTFDGVHIGHQRIIEQLNVEAKKNGGESVLFTFFPHPKMVLFPDSHQLKLLQTQDEKLEKLAQFGLQNTLVFPFTKEFSRMTATEFVRDFLVNKLNVKKLIIGYDHQFGKNREGNIEFLKEVAPIYGFELIEIPAQEIDEVNVSSTKVRRALMEGDVETAASYLGSAYQLNGIVVKGKQLGRTIGFPTANIDLQSDLKLVPAKGVYAVQVKLEDGMIYHGMMNIGERPTVDNSHKVSIEVHVFDFKADIYKQTISVQLLRRIRDEQKFDSIELLTKQLQEDEITVRGIVDTKLV
ncbi:MAG: bifunctional riboflavin kinase/FAD synthetase [Bacteroidota bacterium]